MGTEAAAAAASRPSLARIKSPSMPAARLTAGVDQTGASPESDVYCRFSQWSCRRNRPSS